MNSSAGWTPARSLREGSGLASITGSSEAAPKTGNPNRTNRLLGITRHQITSFSIVNDTLNVGQITPVAKHLG